MSLPSAALTELQILYQNERMDFEADFDNQVWVSRKGGAERRKEKIEARGMGDEGRSSEQRINRPTEHVRWAICASLRAWG